jgi:FSR family fosmidomycin resistance protein-like MFS transporter
MGSLGFSISPAIAAYIVSKWGMKNLTYLLIPFLIWLISIIVNDRGRIANKKDIQKDVNNPDARAVVLRPLLLLSIIVALRAWVASAISIFIPLWLISQGVDKNVAGLNLTFFLLAGTVGGLLGGYLYPVIKKRKVLMMSFIVALCLMPVYFIFPSNLRIIVLLILGFVIMGTFPITVIWGQEIMPHRAGLVSGITMGFAFGLGGAGTSLTGLMADLWGTQTALNITILFLIPAIVLTAFIGITPAKIRKREGIKVNE